MRAIFQNRGRGSCVGGARPDARPRLYAGVACPCHRASNFFEEREFSARRDLGLCVLHFCVANACPLLKLRTPRPSTQTQSEFLFTKDKFPDDDLPPETVAPSLNISRPSATRGIPLVHPLLQFARRRLPIPSMRFVYKKLSNLTTFWLLSA